MQEITSKNLVYKIEADMHRLQSTFENKLSQQKMIHSAFEKKYTVTVMDRISNIEKSLAKVTLE